MRSAEKTGDETASAPTLQEWNPLSWPMAPDWRALVDAFWGSTEGAALAEFIQCRMAGGARIFPPSPFRMLALTPLSSVRVVIVGQDPYHGIGQAEGLAFSVPDGVRVPPSLRNIFKELMREYGVTNPVSGSLQSWAEQGVLLLNTCLTVEEGVAASHAKRGWEVLTRQLLVACNARMGRRVFMLWGAHAQSLRDVVDESRHLVLASNHPSPLSATRGPVPFIGCGHFEMANQWLVEKGGRKIDWIAEFKKTVA